MPPVSKVQPKIYIPHKFGQLQLSLGYRHNLLLSLIDNSRIYVYTYYMNHFPAKILLAEVSQIPTTCMGMHVRRASRIVTQIYDAALRPVGLVLNQFTLLVSIHLLAPVPITRLAQELFTDQTTLTRNLKLLEKQGWVAIVPGDDRRVKLVSLTVEGQTILAQALPLWEQAQVEVKQQFGAEKWQILLSLLSEMKTVG